MVVVRNPDWLRDGVSAQEALREIYKSYIFLSPQDMTEDDYHVAVEFATELGTWTIPVIEDDYFSDPLQPILKAAKNHNVNAVMKDFSTMGHWLCFLFEIKDVTS